MKRTVRASAAIAASFLLVAACGSDGGGAATANTTTSAAQATTIPTTPSGEPIVSMVVDTDMALDDVIALLYVASNPTVDLLAVTVSGTGEVMCPKGAEIARGLLAAVGETDVPVGCGQPKPLSGGRAFPLQWRAAANSAYRMALPEVTAPADEQDAVTLLTDTITGARAPVTVLTLGPLTNLAQAFAAEPALVDLVASVVIMGGAVEVDGNVQPEGATAPLPVEWNLYVDPVAADAVIASGAPVTLVPLDATNQVPVTSDLSDRVEANNATDAAALVLSALGFSTPPFLWDPLAAIAAADPPLVPGHDAAIVVTTEGEEAGRTIADAGGSTVLVADPPDTEAIIDHLLRTLNGLGPDEPLAEPAAPVIVGRATVTFDGTTCTAQAPSSVPVGSMVVTVTVTGIDYGAIVAHLVEGATVEETMAYSDAHPSEVPPTVDIFEAVTPSGTEGTLTSPATVELHPGTTVLVCGTPGGGGFYLGTSFTVA